MKMLNKLRIALAVTLLALAAVSAVDSASAPAVAGEDDPLGSAPASGGYYTPSGNYVVWYGPGP
jgi:hypothetical protein